MDEPTATPRFRVMRQDDNGNVFEITRARDERRAEAIAAEFTARGHKQLYWVERLSED